MSEQREPRHLGVFRDRGSVRVHEPREPKHRGTLADRDFGRLMQDFEHAQRNVDTADTEVPYEFFRRMVRCRRDGFAQEIERRILP